jgi:hypothetical protein
MGINYDNAAADDLFYPPIIINIHITERFFNFDYNK